MSELDSFRTAVRDYLEQASSSPAVRTLMDTEQGYDEAVWRQMANELGLHGIAAPEQWGGAGAGMPELAVVFEEMGAALLCSPFFATVALALQALLDSGDESAIDEFAPPLLDGSQVATLVLNGTLGSWDPTAVTITGQRDDADYRLFGDADLVLDGHTADLVLVVANTAKGTSLFAVPGTASGLTREPLSTLDRTRKVARLRFDAVDRCRRSSRRRPGTHLRPRPGGARLRTTGRRATLPRRRSGLRERAYPVRPRHRQVPSHQAQVCRHAGACRGCPVSGVPCRPGHR